MVKVCAHESGTCKDRVPAVIGQCKWCQKEHCAKHRLAETHNCTAMKDMKDKHHQLNSDKLLNQKTGASKI